MSIPPPYRPIRPLETGSRWFPPGLPFGLYDFGGRVAPNVTSILAESFPFDMSKWRKVEPDIDHEAVRDAAAERGTAVHKALECWLSGVPHQPDPEIDPWVSSLQGLIAKTSHVTTISTETPIFHTVAGIGTYAGSADVLSLVRGKVVLVDFKTKRPNKEVRPEYETKNKLQMAAYSMAIDTIYRDQLPGPVERATLLFAHPDREPTVLKIETEELKSLQEQWLGILAGWFDRHRHEVEQQQLLFESGQQADVVVTPDSVEVPA